MRSDMTDTTKTEQRGEFRRHPPQRILLRHRRNRFVGPRNVSLPRLCQRCALNKQAQCDHVSRHHPRLGRQRRLHAHSDREIRPESIHEGVARERLAVLRDRRPAKLGVWDRPTRESEEEPVGGQPVRGDARQ